jgi:hypothetical protein
MNKKTNQEINQTDNKVDEINQNSTLYPPSTPTSTITSHNNPPNSSKNETKVPHITQTITYPLNLQKNTPKRKENRQINIRVSEEEYQRLFLMANDLGMNVANFCKNKVLKIKTKTPKFNREAGLAIASELRRIGVNLNQVAKGVNVVKQHVEVLSVGYAGHGGDYFVDSSFGADESIRGICDVRGTKNIKNDFGDKETLSIFEMLKRFEEVQSDFEEGLVRAWGVVE